MKILFCDDEQTLLQIYKAEIEDSFPDYEVVTAVNGREALELVKSEKPHYVFTDGKMPELDGLKLTKEILKEENPPKVFLITGYAGTFDEEEIIKIGISKIFYKPIDYNELIEFISQLTRP